MWAAQTPAPAPHTHTWRCPRAGPSHAPPTARTPTHTVPPRKAEAEGGTQGRCSPGDDADSPLGSLTPEGRHLSPRPRRSLRRDLTVGLLMAHWVCGPQPAMSRGGEELGARRLLTDGGPSRRLRPADADHSEERFRRGPCSFTSREARRLTTRPHRGLRTYFLSEYRAAMAEQAIPPVHTAGTHNAD